jgi:hypothetical protein
MCAPTTASEGRKEACKTYIEQTKLLVTLASAFLFAPPSLVAILKDKIAVGLTNKGMCWLLLAECLFVGSVLAGYVVLGSLAGSQDDGSFNVFRGTTRWLSIFQFVLYLAGLGAFIWLAVLLIT